MAIDLFSPSDEALEEVLSVIEQAQREVRYLVIDLPVEMIKSKFDRRNEFSGDIYIPKYQRELRWDEAAMSYFIESVLLRIPIPPLFFYESSGRLEIVDGSQRVRTIAAFVENQFQLSGLEKLDLLNGKTYSELPIVTQKKLLNTPIRTFTMQQDTDGSTRYEMFRRINTSAKRLDDAEIRRGAFQGAFLDVVVECADNYEFRSLINPYFSSSNKRRDELVERQELITRFFVYINF